MVLRSKAQWQPFLSGISLLMVMLLSPLILAVGAAPVQAQGPCGIVDSIDYPVDPGQYGVVYRYGLPSSRFDGKYHAGEDWFGGRASTYGTPVKAVARGRVTYSAPLGWGRDKGVVIIEHQMPDGTWWYSLYGHMEETSEIAFPPVYTCVEAGEVIGAIGRPRPAPHLHLEIRNFGPDSPGPGYWATHPDYSGWQNPSKFIENAQTWLHPAHLWHTDLADTSGSQWSFIVRDDGTTIVFDNGRLKAITPNGDILWRYILGDDRTIAGVLPYQGSILVADTDGRMQLWSLTGGFEESWQLPHRINTTPLTWGNLLVLHTPEDELIAYGPDRTERWRVTDVPRPLNTQTTLRMMSVMSIRGALTLVGLDGTIIGRETLDDTGDLAPAPDGGFTFRSGADLWHIDAAGNRQRLAGSPPVQRGSSALQSSIDGQFFLYSGDRDHTLYGYSVDGQARWAIALDDLQGRPTMLAERGVVLLADRFGTVVAVSAERGTVCNWLNVWGNRAAEAQVNVGIDTVLRLHVADQIIGLDWNILTSGCR